jgi:uncharacterized protein YhaN
MVACMAVMAREAWTDGRLDEFKESVNQRFDEVEKRFDQVDRRFEQVEKRFERVEADIRESRAETKAGFAEVNARLDSMQRTMIICFTGMTASIVASVIGAVLLG